MHSVLEQIGLIGIVPVVAIDEAANAVPLAHALVDGGIPCIEITFRTAAAKETIANIAKSVPEMLLGAGTVLTTEQAATAVGSGARFIVSPGLNRKVVEYCLKNAIPVTPGVATPSDVEAALEYGLEVVKFFPAEASGGIAYLNAISAPYKSMKFIPTGGIDESLLMTYLKSPKVLACGGSWMVKPEMISAGKFEEIKTLSSRAVSTLLGFDLRHVGINCESAEESQRLAALVGDLFRLPLKPGNSSNFAGTQFEFLKQRGRGQHGHIAIGTHSIDRATAYLSRHGIRILPETKSEKNGRLQSVYLDLDVGGFTLHLLQL
jgi:2-dehydro-3-deoxyphosphogluconate aldolase/(4S)-4-hydroxy-2-oxoglutarate aldolase